MTGGKDWMASAIGRAINQYDDAFLRRVAYRIARADPYGADYLEQAPIIAWGLARQVSPDNTQRRSFVGMGNAVERRFRSILADGRKLKTVMAAIGLPLPMRLLRPGVVGPQWHTELVILARSDPSVLGQVLNGSRLHQEYFLREISRFSRGQWPEDYRQWAVGAIGHEALRALGGVSGPFSVGILAEEVSRDVDAVADYLWRSPGMLDVRWSLQEALAAARRWHEELATEKARRDAAEDQCVADYGDLPLRLDVDGFEFVALRTRAELFEEGSALTHCVGSYWDDVFSGVSRIYGIRSNGVRIATMEIARRPFPQFYHSDEVPRFEVAQIRAASNQRPPEPVLQAAATAFARMQPLTATEVSRLETQLGCRAPGAALEVARRMLRQIEGFDTHRLRQMARDHVMAIGLRTPLVASFDLPPETESYLLGLRPGEVRELPDGPREINWPPRRA